MKVSLWRKRVTVVGLVILAAPMLVTLTGMFGVIGLLLTSYRLLACLYSFLVMPVTVVLCCLYPDVQVRGEPRILEVCIDAIAADWMMLWKRLQD